MENALETKIVIEPLRSKEHLRGGFSCSQSKKIENYCRYNIAKQHDAYQVRACVACEEGKSEVLGYYYLNLTSYKIGEKALDDTAENKFGRVNAVPAVYLGMIGVHDDHQKKGIGKMLMRDAMFRTLEIAKQAGTYALTLDALDENLVHYYKQFGFETFKDGNGLEMFLPLKTIQAALH